MHCFTTFFLWALAACTLWNGSFAEDQSGYICLIDDPKQNQCDSYCLSELSPRLSEVVKAQNEGNTNIREFDKEIKSKLETLEVKIGEVQAKLPQEVHAKLEGRLKGVENKLEGRLQGLERQLQAVQNKLEGQLQGVEAKLEGQLQEVQTKVEAKLEKSLHEVKTKLEGQQQEVEKKLERQLQEVQAKLEAKLDKSLLAVQEKIEIQTELQAVLKDINVAKMEIPDRISNNIPPGFELIGNRYFRIVKENANWETAERRCREMGGYLASFRNEEEINALESKLIIFYSYWLGINDRDNDGQYESVASQKPALFLKWKEGEPNDTNHEENCVKIKRGKMRHSNCHIVRYFICQADNET